MEVNITAVPDGIRYFAMQFAASGCEVISPESLREKVKEDIRNIVKYYNI